MRYLAERTVVNNGVYTSFPFNIDLPDFTNADGVYVFIIISSVTGSTPITKWRLVNGANIGGSRIDFNISDTWIQYSGGGFVITYEGYVAWLTVYCVAHSSVTSMTMSMTVRYFGL